MTTQKLFIAIISLIGLLAWGCQNGGSPSNISLDNNMDSVSYIFGINIGQNIKAQDSSINMDAMYVGMKHALENTDELIDPASFQQILMAYQAQLQIKQRAAADKAGAENQAKADAFFAENGQKQGVITDASGLQYEVLQEGTGASPTVEDQVTIHYHGTSLDGKVFDSSVDRGQPATFGLQGLIKAWQIAVPLMKEGGKIRIYSPAALAYGPQGSPPKIGPNEALIFDIELIKVGGQ